MKKVLFFLLFGAFTLALTAQNAEPYEFKEYKRLPATSVKSQDKTGTCWSFSTTSFLESELIRMGKGEHDLSEMFTVRNAYRMKCENYVRRKGKTQFDEGGLAHDKLNVIKRFGIVPESAYPGRKDATRPYNHEQFAEQLKNMCDEFIAQAKKGQLREDWLKSIDQALDAEFGPVPLQFTYKDVVFTPVSFREYLGLNPDDYVNITSYTHHPFWTSFILEVPDNFANGSFFNVPLGDLMRCLNYSIQQGYTVEWDADVSNKGFARNYGLAVVPEADWTLKSQEQIANTFKYWEPEKVVDQAYRQRQFDRLETQDDHLMHIVGILNETHSGVYYVVKNSWGENAGLDGYFHVSEAYMRLNTISFTVNKNALPRDIRRRMGLEPGEVTSEDAPPGPSGTAAPSATPDDDTVPAANKTPAASKNNNRPAHFKVAPASKLKTAPKE